VNKTETDTGQEVWGESVIILLLLLVPLLVVVVAMTHPARMGPRTIPTSDFMTVSTLEQILVEDEDDRSGDATRIDISCKEIG
jgi:hypothetical protein